MTAPDLSRERVSRIQVRLLDWYAENARELPWRRTRDPYAVLVSEVMLQQTQVDRVLPYFAQFMARFPTMRDLAEAPTAEVIRIWSGLGYNRRAVNLQRAATMIVAEFAGVFPKDLDDIRRLPGVGAYTAGAVAAFAFEQDVAFLDTNMRRVVGRLAFGTNLPAANVESALQSAARTLLPEGKSWSWNQALIEFGALHCTARRPNCVLCPLQKDCAAFPLMQGSLALKRQSSRPHQGTPFASTSRYYRGRIVEELRAIPANADGGLELSELGIRVRDEFTPGDMPWLRQIVDGLQRDGLAVIMEEQSVYDADESAAVSGARVRLP